jgi:SAM-dependent methyltransferase
MHYAATIFLSSFLLFVVQPLVARLILPWFGGSAAVWTTCMLFFQALLLAGYAYAHWLVKKLPGRVPQATVHTALLVLAVAMLPIAPAEAWKPTGAEEPVAHILLLLLASVGLPYFMLAANSPLIQAWYARAHPQRNPYRLFALSNFASLVALVGYPTVIEPHLAGREQVQAWSWLFAAFALACALSAWLTPRRAETAGVEAEAGGKLPWLLWLALSAAGSVLLLAVTNHLTQNVASVPLLWLAPLTLYLLTFILAFEGQGAYRPGWMWSFVLVALGAMGWLVADDRFHFDLPLQLGIFLFGLFAGCLFCHGELYRARPAAQHLTAFYLTISAGGALGGVLVAIVAPLVFNAYYELGIGLVALGVLAALRFRSLGAVPQYASLAVLFAVTGGVAYEAFSYHKDVRVSSRSFYGVLRVKEYGNPGDEGHLRRLVHGAIMHGEQYMTGPWRGFITSYYQEPSGVGAAIRAKQAVGPVRVGVIGLGTGTLAAYGRAGDTFRFYDIDPRVVEMARADFTYLGDSPAKIEVAIGDARLALEREAPQGFDVLAVDAFSGDAIPVHLITREALRAYLRQVKPDGIVAFHVSNRFLQLVPVVARLAKEEGVHAAHVSDDPDEDDQSRRSRSDWVLVSRDAKALEAPRIVEAGAQSPEDRPEWRTWTDDYSNLVQILK